MRTDGNPSEGRVSYDPNSYGEWQEQPKNIKNQHSIYWWCRSMNFREDDDNYFEQPGKLFN